MGFFSSHGDYLLLVYLVYVYLIRKKILGQPTTCKTELAAPGNLEWLTAATAETNTEGPSALMSSINQAIEIHPVFLAGKEITLSWGNSAELKNDDCTTKFAQDRHLATVVEDFERCDICHSSPAVVPGANCTDSSDCGSYLFPALFFFFFNTSTSPWTWLHLSPSDWRGP